MYIINKIHMEQNLQCTCIKKKKCYTFYEDSIETV